MHKSLHHQYHLTSNLFNIFHNKKRSYFFADQPEIEQEETFIHTQEGDETEVICVVHSSPKADVKWFKVEKHFIIYLNIYIYYSVPVYVST